MANVRAHEVLAVAGTAVSPATTLAQIREYGSGAILCATNQPVWFTIDGITTPVVTAGSETGVLLRSTDLGIILTPEEFVNSKWLDVSTDARVQFMFLQGDRRRIN